MSSERAGDDELRDLMKSAANAAFERHDGVLPEGFRFYFRRYGQHGGGRWRGTDPHRLDAIQAGDKPMVCQECHSSFEGAGGYHPYLYCELIKLGHQDPEAYLRLYGFVKRPLVAHDVTPIECSA